MKQYKRMNKKKYFLRWDKGYNIPYNHFIKGVKHIEGDLYSTKLKRYVFDVATKKHILKKDEVLLKKTHTTLGLTTPAKIIFLEIYGE